MESDHVREHADVRNSNGRVWVVLGWPDWKFPDTVVDDAGETVLEPAGAVGFDLGGIRKFWRVHVRDRQQPATVVLGELGRVLNRCPRVSCPGSPPAALSGTNNSGRNVIAVPFDDNREELRSNRVAHRRCMMLRAMVRSWTASDAGSVAV